MPPHDHYNTAAQLYTCRPAIAHATRQGSLPLGCFLWEVQGVPCAVRIICLLRNLGLLRHYHHPIRMLLHHGVARYPHPDLITVWPGNLHHPGSKRRYYSLVVLSHGERRFAARDQYLASLSAKERGLWSYYLYRHGYVFAFVSRPKPQWKGFLLPSDSDSTDFSSLAWLL